MCHARRFALKVVVDHPAGDDEEGDGDGLSSDREPPSAPRSRTGKGKAREIAVANTPGRTAGGQGAGKASEDRSNAGQGWKPRVRKKLTTNAGVAMPEDTGLPVVSRAGRSRAARKRTADDEYVGHATGRILLTTWSQDGAAE